MEAAALAFFMLSACLFTVLLEHPMSPVRQALPWSLGRRAVMGAAMGATAVSIIYSPWGQRSGAHMNPAVTVTYWSLGKITGWDALFYVCAQFAGGIAGVAAARQALGGALAHASVNYAVTRPGPRGVAIAFLAACAISLLLMFTVLRVSNSRRLARYTPWFAGLLVAFYITVEAPLSGMSMNPARSLGSDVSAGQWPALWIYFLAPPLAMLAAAQLYRGRVFCAKLHHHNGHRCIFRCQFGAM